MSYITKLTVSFSLLLAAAWPSCVHAQDNGDIGIKPHAPFSNSEIDNVNLATGNVVGTISLVSYPQLGHLPPLTFSAIFNTSAWHIEGTCDPYGDECVAYYVQDYINSIDNFALGANVQSNFKGVHLNVNAYITNNITCGTPYWPYISSGGLCSDITAERDISLTDETGATHPFFYDISNPDWARAADGSGYSFYALGANDPWDGRNWFSQVSGTLYSPTGNTFQLSDTESVETDPAGNSMSIGNFLPGSSTPNLPGSSSAYIDSIGRYIPDPARGISNAPISSCPNLGDPNQTVSSASQWNAPGPNGGTTQYIFCYTGIQIQPIFFHNGDAGGPSCDNAIASVSNNPDELGGEAFTFIGTNNGYYTQASYCNQQGGFGALQSIVLPDGTAWSFLYDAGSPYTDQGVNYYTESYGTVKEIRLPTGGKIQYSYQNLIQISGIFGRSVVTRTETDTAGNVVLKTFSYTTDSSTGLPKTTETTTDGNVAHTFTLASSAFDTGGLYETKAQYYQGPVSGTPLKEIDTTYIINSISNGNSNWGGTSSAFQVLPNYVTTSTPAGVTSEIKKSYTGSYTLAFYSCNVSLIGVSGPPTSSWRGVCGVGQSMPVFLDQVTREDIYDGSSNLLQTTLHNPKYITDTSDVNYTNVNQYGLIGLDQILDGNGAIVAQATYGYDEPGYGSPCSPGPCGNQTSVSRWLNTTGANITSHTSFNSQLMPIVVTDPLGNKTTTTYDSTGLFPFTIQYPSTGSVSHVEYFSYDKNTGSPYWHTDQNGTRTGDPAHTTTYSYDTTGRLTKVVSPPTQNGNGETDYCYTDIGGATCPVTGPPYSVYTTTLATPSPSQTSIQTYDGLGRVIQTIAPSGAITDTTYDLNGRVGSVSTPYYSKNDPTYGVTSFTYDALGRKTVQTQPGPGAYTQQWSYSGNTVTFTDENQNQWVRTSDALGRLTTVFEPNGTSSSPAMETDYGYDELGNLLTVKQWGGSYGSSGAVLRSFSYDSLSRLLTASNPESGSVSYTYDSDGNVKSKTDARNVTISYSYDALNRLLSKSYSDGTTPTSCYQYDSTTIANGKGRLANAWTQSASAACSLAAASWTKRSILAYDALGRILKEQQCTPSNCANGAPYSPAYTYDLAGNLLSSTSGVGPTPTSTPFIFSNTFDNAGRLHTLASNWTTNYVNGRPNIFPATLFSAQTVTSAMCPKSFTTPYAPFGSLVNASFGTALTLNRGFDQRLRTTCENDTGGNVATPTGGSVAVTITGSEQSK